MHHTANYLNRYIHAIFLPALFEQEYIQAGTAELIRRIQAEILNLRNTLFNHDPSLQHTEAFAVFIQRQQATITMQLDLLHRYKGEEMEVKGKKAAHPGLQRMRSELEGLLLSLHYYYPQHFNHHAKMPAAMAADFQKEFASLHQEVSRLMEEKLRTPELMAAFRVPGQRYLQPAYPFSYYQAIYLEELYQALRLFMNNKEASQPAASLQKLLFRYNFNSNSYHQYCIDQTRQALQEAEDDGTKILLLRRLLKENNQWEIKPGYALKHERASIQTLLGEWLEHEIGFLEDKQRHSRQLAETGAGTGTGADGSRNPKIPTKLSVAQLGCLLRLMLSAFIRHENKTDIIRQFAAIFSSSRNENISPESLRKKCYSMEATTASSVREMLLEMAKECREMG